MVRDTKERDMSSRIRPWVSGWVWSGNIEAETENGARGNYAREQWWGRTFQNMGLQAWAE